MSDDDNMKDTFAPGTRVLLSREWQRAGAPRIEGTVVEYDGEYQADLVPVKWDNEPSILFPERGVLERIDRTEAMNHRVPCESCKTTGLSSVGVIDGEMRCPDCRGSGYSVPKRGSGRIQSLFVTPEGKITRRNAQFIVRVFTWAIRKRPIVRDTSLEGVATRLHEAMGRAGLSQGIKRKKLVHVLRMGEHLGVLEVKRG